MKISVLIQFLQDAVLKHGDVNVMCGDAGSLSIREPEISGDEELTTGDGNDRDTLVI